MKYKIRAGYNMFNKGSGLLDEKIELKNIINKCEEYIKILGHELVDNNADWNIYIRLNSGKLEEEIDNGVRAYVYPESSAYGKAMDVISALCKLGYRRQGVKLRYKDSRLKSNSKNTILLFCCFLDNGTDYMLYNSDKIAKAIVESITGQSIDIFYPTIYNDMDYNLVYSYNDYIKYHKEVKDMSPEDALKYFVEEGMATGHKAKETFDVHYYIKRYPELKFAFGDNYKAYYTHYMLHGYYDHNIAYPPTNKEFTDVRIKVIANELPMHIDAGKGFDYDGFVHAGDELDITFVRNGYGLIKDKNRWISISTKFVKYIRSKRQ